MTGYRFPSKTDDNARAARLERIRAARSTTPAYGPEQTIAQCDLEPGDYVVRLSAPGYRPVAVGTILTGLTVTGGCARFTFADDVIAGRGSWNERLDAYHRGSALIRRRVA